MREGDEGVAGGLADPMWASDGMECPVTVLLDGFRDSEALYVSHFLPQVTILAHPPERVEQPPRGREAVAVSRRGRGAGDGGGEVRPGHGGGVVGVQVVEEACRWDPDAGGRRCDRRNTPHPVGCVSYY